MNKYVLIAVTFFVMMNTGAAQHPDMKNGLFFKRVFADHQTLDGGSFFDFKSYRPAWELGYSRQVMPHLNITVPVRAGVYSVNTENTVNRPYLGGDILGQYYFGSDDKIILPYIEGGTGVARSYDGVLNVQFPIGAGIFVKIYDGAYFTADASYRYGTKKSNLQYGVGFVYSLNHLVDKLKVVQEGMDESEKDADGDGIVDALDLCPSIAGPKELMGCPDSDHDGIEDSKDKCPDIAGPKELMGCPDGDGDGIADVEDKCPNLSGLPENGGCPLEDNDNDGIPNDKDRCPNVAGAKSAMGCPDSDGDGVADDLDKCPNLKGLVERQGCPMVSDRDGDGVPDNEDNCPNIKGTTANRGCPGVTDSDGDGISDDKDKCPQRVGVIQFDGCPDTDGDGIPDSEDYCPNTRGAASAHGCPEIQKEDREVLDIAMRAVQFETGKATLKYSSFVVLDKIAEIMRKYKDYNLIISGHTDNTGRAVINQRLSERRAKACYEYLINRGVGAKRMRYAGYGESRPIADNLTHEGRALNRRVEFKLVPARK